MKRELPRFPGHDPGAAVDTSRGQPPPTGRRPRVGMALYGDLTFDSRVRREARSLADAGYPVTIVCLAADAAPADLPAGVTIVVRGRLGNSVAPGSPNPFFASRGSRLAALRHRAAWLVGYVRGLRTWGRLAVEAAGPVDIWHAHDLTGLAAIVPRLRGGVPVVFDSHELFLESGTARRLPAPVRLALQGYESWLVSRVSAVITVNEALASVLRRRYPRQRVTAIHNCPKRWVSPAVRPTALRDVADVPEGAPVVLYHGALSADRGIEQLMQATPEPHLQDAHLFLMGSGHLREDFARASASARWRGRVHVLPPVPPTQLLAWVASADIGAMPLQRTTLNHWLSTPNKLFECLAGGTPAVASDFPAMREIIIDNPGGPLGAVCNPESVRSIADAIRSILDLERPDMDALRARCSRAATERWNWDHEARALLSVYAEVTLRGN